MRRGVIEIRCRHSSLGGLVRRIGSLRARFAPVCLALAGAATGTGFVPKTASAASAEAQPFSDDLPNDIQAVYLDVELNGRPTGVVLRFTIEDGELFARPEDLKEAGIVVPDVPPSPPVPLKSISGLTYRFDPAMQKVAIHVLPSLRTAYVHGSGHGEPIPTATAGTGLLINYDAFYQYDHASNLALWNEWRFFSPSGVVQNTGTMYSGDQARGRSYVRFDTTWTRADPNRMRTLRIGDTISSGLDWSRPVRMAGLQISSDFELRPDLVTYPLPELGGLAIVPSSVDLFINNVRRASVDVPDGPFLFQETPGITGSGSATIVSRDALGRTVASAVPLYIDRRLLAPGLNAYSIEAGFMRRHYGLTSFSYARDPVMAATWRHGISEDMTMEGHAEATSGMYNAGVGALARLGTVGVVHAAVAGSSGDGRGLRTTLGYQSIHPRFTLDLQTMRTHGDYRDLGTTEGAPVPKKVDRATLAFPLSARQSVALNYVGYHLSGTTPSRIVSAAYSATAGRRASVNLSAYRDIGADNETGVFLSVNLALDDGSYVGAYAGRQNGQLSHNVMASRPMDYDGGWGWGVQSGRAASNTWQHAQTGFRGRYGEVTAMAQRSGGRESVAVNAAGGIVVMDGGVSMSRRIHDGFALVSTAGFSDVPVLHENRRIGTTNADGRYVVPDLNAYQRNRIAIDTLGLPANIRVDSDSAIVVPGIRSGVLVDLALTEYRAATVVLHDASGRPLPVGTKIIHEESASTTVVGYDGRAFIEGLASHNRLRLMQNGGDCFVEFSYRPPEDSALPTLGPLLCEPAQ